MHILIDLQASQASNAQRGIGRYSLLLTKAFLENKHENRISVLLNGTFQESIGLIKKKLEGLLPENNLFIWYPSKQIQFIDPNGSLKRKSAELIREAYIHEISPDILVNMSLFEGLIDDSILSIGAFSSKIKTVTILYDLIPYIYPEKYLQNDLFKKWYFEKLDHLKRSDLLLSISESSKQEAINYLGFEESKVINILGDADPRFKIEEYPDDIIKQVLKQYKIIKPFLMYTGGIDFRKNIERLIEAYSLLPNEIKERYQLLVVCSIQQDEKVKLLNIVAVCGLTEKDVIFTGYIPDEDLILLYNCCKLFVFPSWHEGFGLPVLEAMRCGAPVVASNLSSLPEIVGNEIALFNPLCVHSISDKIKEVLSNQELYQQLKKHSDEQAKKFSWNSSAIKALKTFEIICAKNKKIECNYSKEKLIQRPRLAYISPLPPAKSGIASYNAELIPELLKYYAIDVIVDQRVVDCPEVTASCYIRDVDWFRKNASKFDKIIYHFGNSEFHNYMFSLLDSFPGVVVLHDFFLSGIQAHREIHLGITNAMSKELYNAHGYKAIQEWNTEIDKTRIIMHYPCNFSILKNATSIIVHSNYSMDLARKWYGTHSIQKFEKIPHLRKLHQQGSKEQARTNLRIDKDEFVVCSFGILVSTKRNLELIDAFLHSKIGNRANSKLIFVGYLEEKGLYCQQINDYISNNDLTEKVKITGWVDDKTLMNYLAATDMAVQLRANSRGETSGTILDCLNLGVATIINANETFNELPEDIIHKISNDFNQQELIDALDSLALNSQLRENYSIKGKNHIKLYHQPQKCAQEYFQTIEKSKRTRELIKDSLISRISDLDLSGNNDGSFIQIANAIAKTFPSNGRQKQLLIDITELHESQINTGIQRVVRNVVLHFIANPPIEYRVEPIYWNDEEQSYCYARKFTCQLLEIESVALEDELLQVAKDDIYLGLDLILKQIQKTKGYLERMKREGVVIYFVVYDLIPYLNPAFFPVEAKSLYTNWLNLTKHYDGFFAISKTVAKQLEKLLLPLTEPKIPRIDWFHLGADLPNTNIQNLDEIKEDDQVQLLLEKIHVTNSFLMVGTIEPRKGHKQVLEAFENLWNLDQGKDAILILIGKQGWMVDEVLEQIKNHVEYNRKLFWIESANDSLLQILYQNCSALIAASETEGFGLPLIEAAKFHLPIIARDISVFREIAGEHAFYFTCKTPMELAQLIEKWIRLYELDEHPKSDRLPWLTWKESAEALKKLIFNNVILESIDGEFE